MSYEVKSGSSDEVRVATEGSYTPEISARVLIKEADRGISLRSIVP